MLTSWFQNFIGEADDPSLKEEIPVDTAESAEVVRESKSALMDVGSSYMGVLKKMFIPAQARLETVKNYRYYNSKSAVELRLKPHEFLIRPLPYKEEQQHHQQAKDIRQPNKERLLSKAEANTHLMKVSDEIARKVNSIDDRYLQGQRLENRVQTTRKVDDGFGGGGGGGEKKQRRQRPDYLTNNIPV